MLPRNRGKGAALLIAFDTLFARGFDGWSRSTRTASTCPRRSRCLLEAARGAELVLGTRDHLFAEMELAAPRQQPPLLLGDLGPAGQRLPDVQTGFRLYTRSLMEATGFPGDRVSTQRAPWWCVPPAAGYASCRSRAAGFRRRTDHEPLSARRGQHAHRARGASAPAWRRQAMSEPRSWSQAAAAGSAGRSSRRWWPRAVPSPSPTTSERRAPRPVEEATQWPGSGLPARSPGPRAAEGHSWPRWRRPVGELHGLVNNAGRAARVDPRHDVGRDWEQVSTSTSAAPSAAAGPCCRGCCTGGGARSSTSRR